MKNWLQTLKKDLWVIENQTLMRYTCNTQKTVYWSIKSWSELNKYIDIPQSVKSKNHCIPEKHKTKPIIPAIKPCGLWRCLHTPVLTKFMEWNTGIAYVCHTEWNLLYEQIKIFCLIPIPDKPSLMSEEVSITRGRLKFR